MIFRVLTILSIFAWALSSASQAHAAETQPAQYNYRSSLDPIATAFTGSKEAVADYNCRKQYPNPQATSGQAWRYITPFQLSPNGENFNVSCYSEQQWPAGTWANPAYVNAGQAVKNVLSCPAGWTLNGTNCVKDSNPCEENPDQWKGQGVTYGGSNSQVCYQGCTVNLMSSPEVCLADGTCYDKMGSKTGAACSSSTAQNTPNAEQECLNKGQGFITIGGQTTCMSPSSPEAPPMTVKDKTTTTTVNNIDNSTTTTTETTTTNYSGGGGPVTTEKTTETSTAPAGGGGGTVANQTETKTQSASEYCKQNPTAAQCQIASNITAKEWTEVPESFYTPEYENGITGVYENFKLQLDTSSFVTAIHTLMPSGWNGGSAPSWTISLGNLGAYTLQPPSYIWSFIRICMIITALFYARSLIFGG